YVVLNSTIIAALERADVDDHINLTRAVEDRAPRLVSLHVRERRAERKTDHGADGNTRAAQMTGRGAHPRRIHTDGCEMKTRGLFAEPFDVVFRRFRFQERVVNQTRPISGRSCLP